MIMKLIDEALIEHRFVKEQVNDISNFYIRETGEAIRFAIVYKLNELITPQELNEKILRVVPESFANNPAFKKNCDLICIHHIAKLAEFKSHEERIFAIEEDPHFFKKYVLYYSEAEEKALQGHSYKNLQEIIFDKKLFNDYKDHPLKASQYSVVAKIFIKLPFLELPFKSKELVPLRLQAAEAVSEVGLTKLYENIQKLNSSNIDVLFKEIVNDELANIQN